MLKILHISDLHFCVKSLRPSLENFQKEAATVYKIDLEIHVPKDRVLEDLVKLIAREDPDVIALTGDITTFGDMDSYREAGRWLKSVSFRASGKESRKVVVVPGNHDALDKQLALLINCNKFVRWLLVFGGRLRILKPIKAIQALLPSNAEKDDLLKNYNLFVSENSDFITSSKSVFQIGGHPGSKVAIFPFDTLSSNPLWLNLGEIRDQECRKFISNIEAENESGCLKIVLCHHNPVSSPGKIDSKLVNAYNSMPGGTEFLKMLQSSGVNLVLYGHQHTPAAYAYDFDLRTAGQTFALASACSSASEGGCNLIRIADVNHVDVSQFTHDERKGFVVADVSKDRFGLALERNRPTDNNTIAARLEIKGFLNGNEPGIADFWDDLQREKKGLVYMSGRHFKMFRDREFDSISDFLERSSENRLRLLITDPVLAKRIAGADDAVGGQRKIDIWGATEELEELAKNAQLSLDSLIDYINRQGPNIKKRIDVRVSHTIMPFAALVSEADKPWSKMAVRILPIGAYGAVDTPLLKLNRRVDQTLFEFYLKHMRFLFLCGKRCAGDWDYGNGDLEIGFNSTILARLAEV